MPQYPYPNGSTYLSPRSNLSWNPGTYSLNRKSSGPANPDHYPLPTFPRQSIFRPTHVPMYSRKVWLSKPGKYYIPSLPGLYHNRNDSSGEYGQPTYPRQTTSSILYSRNDRSRPMYYTFSTIRVIPNDNKKRTPIYPFSRWTRWPYRHYFPHLEQLRHHSWQYWTPGTWDYSISWRSPSSSSVNNRETNFLYYPPVDHRFPYNDRIE